MQETHKQLYIQDITKAPGPYGISVCILKEHRDQLVGRFSNSMFNKVGENAKGEVLI